MFSEDKTNIRLRRDLVLGPGEFQLSISLSTSEPIAKQSISKPFDEVAKELGLSHRELEVLRQIAFSESNRRPSEYLHSH